MIPDSAQTSVQLQSGDAHWRAEMANCFNVLRCLLTPSASKNRRLRGRKNVLRAAFEHLNYLEDTLSNLLKAANRRSLSVPRDLRSVGETFIGIVASGSMRRTSESSSQEITPSLELLRGQICKTFTVVRAPNSAGTDLSLHENVDVENVRNSCWSRGPRGTSDIAVPWSPQEVESMLQDDVRFLSSSPDQVVPWDVVPPSLASQDQLVPTDSQDVLEADVHDPVLGSVQLTAETPEKTPPMFDHNWLSDILCSDTYWTSSEEF